MRRGRPLMSSGTRAVSVVATYSDSLCSVAPAKGECCVQAPLRSKLSASTQRGGYNAYCSPGVNCGLCVAMLRTTWCSWQASIVSWKCRCGYDPNLFIKSTSSERIHSCHGKFEAVESTAAILLRKRNFSDTSLIVSWCTESLGCIQTVAKGARRAKSPFAGKLDLFFETEIQIARSRKANLHTLTAAYFVELVEICTERDHHEPELFSLLLRAFGYLDANDPTLRAISHFETELACIAGVHDAKKLKSDPAFALGNLFGKLPLSRTPLLKTLAARNKRKK